MADGSDNRTPRPSAYRAKLMTANGRIETSVAIMAASEDEALEQARGLALSYAVELWDGGRLIASLARQKR